MGLIHSDCFISLIKFCQSWHQLLEFVLILSGIDDTIIIGAGDSHQTPTVWTRAIPINIHFLATIADKLEPLLVVLG